jgi:hypothetical protein
MRRYTVGPHVVTHPSHVCVGKPPRPGKGRGGFLLFRHPGPAPGGGPRISPMARGCIIRTTAQSLRVRCEALSVRSLRPLLSGRALEPSLARGERFTGHTPGRPGRWRDCPPVTHASSTCPTAAEVQLAVASLAWGRAPAPGAVQQHRTPRGAGCDSWPAPDRTRGPTLAGAQANRWLTPQHEASACANDGRYVLRRSGWSSP